jgi:hypothetical protein
VKQISNWEIKGNNILTGRNSAMSQKKLHAIQLRKQAQKKWKVPHLSQKHSTV